MMGENVNVGDACLHARVHYVMSHDGFLVYVVCSTCLKTWSANNLARTNPQPMEGHATTTNERNEHE